MSQSHLKSNDLQVFILKVVRDANLASVHYRELKGFLWIAEKAEFAASRRKASNKQDNLT